MDYQKLYEAELRKVEQCRAQFIEMAAKLRAIRREIESEDIELYSDPPSRWAETDERRNYRGETRHTLELSEALAAMLLRDTSTTFAGDVVEWSSDDEDDPGF